MTTRIRWSALIAALLVPVLLAGGLLWGVSGGDARVRQVRAAIVNLDEMVEINGQMMPMGRQLAAELVSSDREQNFAWQLATQAKASEGLANGEYAAVVTIPREFSAAATSFAKPADEATQATITVQTSPVVGISETAIGQSVAFASTQALNGFLTREYLQNIYLGFNDMSTSMLDLVDGTRQLADGTAQLSDGANQSADGAYQLSQGLGTAAAGGGQLSAGASAAATGASELAVGAGALADGAEAYSAGALTFVDGVSTFATGVGDYATGVGTYTDGVVTYTDGVAQYAGGINAILAPVRSGLASLPEWGPWLDRIDAWVAQAPGQAEQASARMKAAIAVARDYVRQAGDLAAGADQLSAAAAAARTQAATLASSGLACPAGLSEEACAGYQAGAQAAGAAMGERLAPVAQGASALAEGTADLGELGQRVLAALDELERVADALPAWAAQLQASYGQLVGSIPEGTPTSQAEILGLLDQLTDAGTQLTTGGQQLATGGAELAAGGRQLADGAGSLADGALQLADGASGIADGMGQLADGSRQLADGSRQLADGVGAFADGVGAAATGSRQLADGLEQLADGTHELAGGAAQLADGVADGQGEIPTYTDAEREQLATVVAAPVDADGLAGVVRPHLAWVSMLLVVALWAGALATFAVLRPVAPDALTSRASTVRLFGRTLLPALGVSLAQAVVLGGLGGWALSWTAPATAALMGVLALASVAFVLVNLVLAAWLGHGGRLLALALAVITVIASATSAAPDAVGALGAFSPLTPALTGVQALAVGGSVVIPVVTLVGWALLGIAGAMGATHRARSVSVEKVVALAGDPA